MTSYRLPSFRFALASLLTAFLTVCAAPGAAHAQQQHQRAERPRNGVNLPAWSRPLPPGQTERTRTPKAPAPVQKLYSSGPPDLNTETPTSQAPLGGVEWLALAGAGYAIRRLRKSGNDDEEAEG